MSKNKKDKNEIYILLQEAFYAGWVAGFTYCYTPIREKADSASVGMIRDYKNNKKRINAFYRERSRRKNERRYTAPKSLDRKQKLKR